MTRLLAAQARNAVVDVARTGAAVAVVSLLSKHHRRCIHTLGRHLALVARH